MTRANKTRGLLMLVLVAIAVLAVPAAAVPEGRIVIQGAASGSHLKVEANGANVVVRGAMADAMPRGCRYAAGHRVAVCPIDRAGSIEVNMSSTHDFLEVEGSLPLSLTTYLGSGEDRFVGGGERDTCFSEGTKRNRCIGGGGNDVCITGARNSDCVGGPGNDYCKTDSGSDGCWGGPGDDVCYMGSGHDGCHGEGGDDRLYGEEDADQLYGGEGEDYCDGGPGFGHSRECEVGPRH